MRIVNKIAQQHEEIMRAASSFQRLGLFKPESNKFNSGFLGNNNVRDNSSQEWGMSGKEKGYFGEIDSSGDTYMGGVHSTNLVLGSNGKPLRSKWKTSEQIDRLGREGKCFRCERKGCSTNMSIRIWFPNVSLFSLIVKTKKASNFSFLLSTSNSILSSFYCVCR